MPRKLTPYEIDLLLVTAPAKPAYLAAWVRRIAAAVPEMSHQQRCAARRVAVWWTEGISYYRATAAVLRAAHELRAVVGATDEEVRAIAATMR